MVTEAYDGVSVEGITASEVQLIDRLLTVIEDAIVPVTQKGVREGSKVFGAAILRKSDLSLVLAASNNEKDNPLWHGEVHAIKLLYEKPSSERPNPAGCIFLATHEPCPLCLSAITWGGYDNFFYLFSYEDSRDAFNIPHDLKILKEVFTLGPGEYAQENHFWKSYDIMEMIRAVEDEECTSSKSLDRSRFISKLRLIAFRLDPIIPQIHAAIASV
jgi:tRNA(Arg) A34 adenosine deaminase TadA